jgi:hypothetical protein
MPHVAAERQAKNALEENAANCGPEIRAGLKIEKWGEKF